MWTAVRGNAEKLLIGKSYHSFVELYIGYSVVGCFLITFPVCWLALVFNENGCTVVLSQTLKRFFLPLPSCMSHGEAVSRRDVANPCVPDPRGLFQVIEGAAKSAHIPRLLKHFGQLHVYGESASPAEKR